MDDWRGNVVAKLHNAKITQRELASEMGVTFQYVCMVLSPKCSKTPKDMESRMMAAIDSIIGKR